MKTSNVIEDYSLTSLYYFAELGVNNCTIVINPNVPSPFRNKIMIFEGYANKKCYGNTFAVVDSWSHIKKILGNVQKAV